MALALRACNHDFGLKALLLFSYRHPGLVVFITVVLTVLLGWRIPELELDTSAEVLMPKRTEAWHEYERVRDTFGSDETVVIYAESPDLFSNEKLASLKAIANRLDALPFVERTDSLFSVNNIDGSSGFVESGPLVSKLPLSEAELSKARASALRNPLLLGNLIGEKAEATSISVYLKPDFDLKSLTNSQAVDSNLRLDEYMTVEIEAILLTERELWTDLFAIGGPIVRTEMTTAITNDQFTLLPASGLLLIVLIGLTLRSLREPLVPLLNAVIATIWLLGLMVLLGVPINMLNYIVPALIFVIGATEDVHVLAEYRMMRLSGLDREDAFTAAVQHLDLTLMLTGITTVLGFGASGISTIPALQQFGITAAAGMLIRFLMTLTLLPAWLKWFPSNITVAEPVVSSETVEEGSETSPSEIAPVIIQQAVDWIMRVPVSNPAMVLGVAGLMTIPALYFASKIQLDNDMLGFLDQKSTIVQQITKTTERLAGTKIVYLNLQGNPGDFRNASKLQQMHSIADALRKTEGVDSVIGLSDQLALVNREIRQGSETDYQAPQTDRLAAQLLMFFHAADLKPYVTPDYAESNMVIRLNVENSSALNGLVRDFRERLDSGEFGPLNYSLTGHSILINSAVDRLSLGQVSSLLVIGTLLFAIIALLFLSGRCGLQALLANLFAIIMVFGLMGLLGIPLNVGTCMVAAITLGIGVDDTLHLMVRYNRELKHLKDEHEAIRRSLLGEMVPVMVTSIALAGGFGLLMFSTFVPIQQFGMLSAFVVIVAVIADLILIPVMISTTRLITIWDILEFKIRKRLEDESDFFAHLTGWQVKKVILLSHLQKHEAGEWLIRQGDVGEHMYIIVDGELEVSVENHGKRIKLATLGPGDALGEIALITQDRRTADVQIMTDTKLLAIDWESLLKLKRYNPYLASQLYLNIAQILGKRLNRATSQVG